MESAQTSPQIVHESETQRQFVRLKMPSRVEIEGEQYPVRDLSPGGAGVEGVARHYGEGAEVPVKLILPFDGFSLDVAVTARIRHYMNANKVLGLQFVDLTPEQVSILTYVVKAYIAGDVLNMGDILSITARENFVRVRKKKEVAPVNYSFAFQARKYVGTALISLLGIVVSVFIIANIYESVFMVKASDGAVMANIVNVRAPQAGVYTSAVADDVLKVSVGQELGSFSDGSKLISPCDCTVFSDTQNTPGYVDAGATVLRLIPEDTVPYISVTLPIGDVYRLKVNGFATFRVAGTNIEMKGKIKTIEASAPEFGSNVVADSIQSVAKVRIESDQKIMPDFIGRPVLVRFRI